MGCGPPAWVMFLRSFMKRAFHPPALLPYVLATVLFGGCGGEERTYTDHLVRGARAAEGQETRQNLELIGSALERYAMDHGGYPEASSVQEIEDLVTPIYMSRVPQRDSWRQEWRLTSSADRFVLSSDGPDGVPETEDDLKRESGIRGAFPGL